MIAQFEKPSFNKEFRIMEFRRPDGQGQLGPDETIVSATIVATNYKTNEDVTLSMISDVAPYDLTKVRYRLSGGVRGETYLLEVRITTSTQQDLGDYLLVMVT